MLSEKAQITRTDIDVTTLRVRFGYATPLADRLFYAAPRAGCRVISPCRRAPYVFRDVLPTLYVYATPAPTRYAPLLTTLMIRAAPPRCAVPLRCARRHSTFLRERTNASCRVYMRAVYMRWRPRFVHVAITLFYATV